MLDDRTDRDVTGRDGRLGSGELGPFDGNARHGADEATVDDDDEAQDDRIPVASPRGRMNQDRWSDDIANDPVGDLDGMLGRSELEDPRLRPVRPSQQEPVAVEPHDEDLGLDRAVDIPTGGLAAHRVIVAIGARIMPGVDQFAT